ncbi:probable glycosyltransferase At5g03795 [Salvia miltiorrhiza]|uniref:probable glycosyltransferase At5g03795 n=1 Tax=Salvia miltiorrhiza TaxID=226208 RepID=UPI0025ACE13A|nr:probable glycosyltransferase At5g03795 [Salvia miltiorrhiza]
MADPSSFSSSPKLVYFVLIPLLMLSALVILLNQKPSASFSWPPQPLSYTPASATTIVEDQPPPPPPPPPPVVESMRKHMDSDKLDMVEASLAKARANIHEAQRSNESSDDADYVPQGPFYRNPNAFHRSYLEMENTLRFYIYEEGEPPLFHYSKSLGILGIEGIIIHQMEISKFRTRDPQKAHLFLVPLSVQSIVAYAYVIHNRAWDPLRNIAIDYINLISTNHPYWNRTLGHDHFIIGCHDWTPKVSRGVAHLYKNSIRVLCNANTSEGFKPETDVSMPEIHLPEGTTEGLIGGPGAEKRSILVFYAGGIHGYIREVLMEKWRNRDKEVQVHEYLPKNMSYYGMMRRSKYCICPSGWEVASPRMVEAIYMGCVPLLLKDHYAKPFDDVLDWTKFAVEVEVKDIPNLKNILKAIPPDRYVEMQRNGVKVRRHFEVNFPPKRYDVFHMILHSVWLRRINVQLHHAH